MSAIPSAGLNSNGTRILSPFPLLFSLPPPLISHFHFSEPVSDKPSPLASGTLAGVSAPTPTTFNTLSVIPGNTSFPPLIFSPSSFYKPPNLQISIGSLAAVNALTNRISSLEVNNPKVSLSVLFISFLIYLFWFYPLLTLSQSPQFGSSKLLPRFQL